MSVFESISSTLSSTASKAVTVLSDRGADLLKDARGTADRLATTISGGTPGLVQDAGATLAGGFGDVVQDTAGEILGSIGDSGGVLGTLAGALGGVFDTQRARSTWGRLNPYLMAQLYACDAQGNMAETGMVSGPISDDNMELGFNWQSPFENSGPESKVPSIMAMLQSGQAAMVINALQASGVLGTSDDLNRIADNAQQAVKDLEGRTGITKLNSRQVFSGMPPVKVNFTLHLRAMRDSQSELRDLYERLMSWSLPQQLAKDSFLTGIVRETGDLPGMLRALFPSKAPQLVSLYYGRLAMPPMVVEHVSHPLSAPMARDGNWIYLPVQVQLATLTAMDRQDLAFLFR
ncbi:hypothetical protein BJP27_24105 (plasmid) [Pseudomonas oryzihabitans]|nr:hypothetical protein BJP27_24105 [Pseudomonas psychrotolerans]